MHIHEPGISAPGERLFFSNSEIEKLKLARQKVDAAKGEVLYLTWENPFAKSGGIFAVSVNYIGELRSQGRKARLISPYHSRLRTSPPEKELSKVGVGKVPYGPHEIDFEIYEYKDKQGNTWNFIKADGFFEAHGGPDGTDPYKPDEKLLYDALFFGAAIPKALKLLGLTKDVIVHLQDWQTSFVALKVKEAILAGDIKTAVVVLTSHNPYDHAIFSKELSLITDRVPVVETAYGYTIGLSDGPVSTVSDTFAEEMTTDTLQTGHFTDHLQPVLKRQGVVGVNNGLFGKPANAFSVSSTKDAKRGRPGHILWEKMELRHKMLQTLQAYNLDESRVVGSLDWDNLLQHDVPIFMMFGRLDPGQKGFDVLSRAIERFDRWAARFILTPSVSEPTAFSHDLVQLAHRFEGEVVLYPFRMSQGYIEAMSGSSFVVLPSLYEPFGAATEPYLNGTPVVARATGGLLQQIVDVNEDPNKGTGILYHEESDLPADVLGQQWHEVQHSDPYHRMQIPLYENMVEALTKALRQANAIYRHDKSQYSRMLTNLSTKATEFSWDQTAKGYQKIYSEATQ